MIARRFTPAETSKLQEGERVLWLKAGGTNYQEVWFVRHAQDRSGWCWVKTAPDAIAMKALKLSSLGTDQARPEGKLK